jgi:hypothetical protein
MNHSQLAAALWMMLSFGDGGCVLGVPEVTPWQTPKAIAPAIAKHTTTSFMMALRRRCLRSVLEVKQGSARELIMIKRVPPGMVDHAKGL